MAVAIVFIAINLAAIPGFLYLQERVSPRWSLAWLVFLSAESLLAAFYTLFTFGGAFGPGVLLFFSPCLSVPLSLLFLGWGWRCFSTTPNRVGFSRRGYLLGGLAIMAMQTAPIPGFTLGVPARCVLDHCIGRSHPFGGQDLAGGAGGLP